MDKDESYQIRRNLGVHFMQILKTRYFLRQITDDLSKGAREKEEPKKKKTGKLTSAPKRIKSSQNQVKITMKMTKN